VLIAQEERCEQRVYISYYKNSNSWVATCAPPHRGFYDYRHKAPVRLVVEKNVPTLNMSLPSVTDPIPVVIIMRALGFSTDKDFMEVVCYDFSDLQFLELLRPSVLAADDLMIKFLKGKKGKSTTTMQAARAQEEALAYIGAKKRNNTKPKEADAGRDVLQLLFQHLGEGYRQKAYFLGYIIRQICLTKLGRLPQLDKDHYKNIRLDLAGQLLRHQFRAAMAHLQRDIGKQVQKHLGKDDCLLAIKSFVQESIISRTLQSAFTLGNWNTCNGVRSSGVVADIKRTNTIAMISHLRQLRLNMPPKTRPTESARHPYVSALSFYNFLYMHGRFSWSHVVQSDMLFAACEI
jgi:DNA-directed RNA polymerase beta subunit